MQEALVGAEKKFDAKDGRLPIHIIPIPERTISVAGVHAEHEDDHAPSDVVDEQQSRRAAHSPQNRGRSGKANLPAWTCMRPSSGQRCRGGNTFPGLTSPSASKAHFSPCCWFRSISLNTSAMRTP